METELIGDLSSVHGVGQILLVGEDKQEGITQLVLVEHPLEFLTRFRDTFPIVGVDDEDDTLGVLEVYVARDRVRCGAGRDTSDAEQKMRRTMPPEGTDLVLASDVPDGERDVLVLYSLDVETCSRTLGVSVCIAGARKAGGLTNGGDGGDNLAQLQFVQDSGFTSGIQTDLCNPSVPRVRVWEEGGTNHQYT